MANIPINLKLVATQKISAALQSAGAAVGTLGNKLAAAQRRFQTFQKSTEETRKKLTKLGDGIKSIGTKVTAFATLPITGALAGSVKAFATFENEMTAVKTLLDDKSFTGESVESGFKKMQLAAQALANTVPVNISSMNKALFDSVSAGVEAGKAVQFVEQSAKLSVAGLTDISTATDGMTTALNAFGLKAADAEKIAAKFFVAQKRGKTTIAELSTDIGKVAATANALGVSLEEVLATTAAATAGGIKTNEAFTSMKAVFANIIKPTTDATKLAKGLGVGFDSVTLRKKGIVKFFDDIIKATKKVGGDPKRAFEILFGSTEALNLALTVTGSQAELFANTLGELKDETAAVTTFQKAFAEQSKTTANKMELLKNKAIVLGQKIGSKLAPYVDKIADKIGRFFDIIENNPALQKFIIVIGLVVAVLGPLILAVGTLITLVPLMMTGFAVLAPVFGALAGAALPLIGALMILAGTAMVIYKNWDKIIDIFSNFDEVIDGISLTIKEVLIGAIEAIAPALDFISKKFSAFVNPIKNFFSGPLNMLFGGFDKTKVADPTAGGDGFPTVTPFGQKPGVLGPTTPLGAPKAIAPTAVSNVNKSESNITVDFKNLPQGSKVKTSKGSSDSLTINSGMQGAFGT